MASVVVSQCSLHSFKINRLRCTAPIFRKEFFCLGEGSNLPSQQRFFLRTLFNDHPRFALRCYRLASPKNGSSVGSDFVAQDFSGDEIAKADVHRRGRWNQLISEVLHFPATCGNVFRFL